jgi:adenylate kinase
MALQKIIVVLGPPGSGKGTQSKLLVEKLAYAFFGMGDALRAYGKRDNEVAKKIKAIIDQGYIVTDDLAEIVATESLESISDKPGLISEGYPRTPGQVEIIDKFMAKHGITDLKVLSIQADKQKLIDRILKRGKLEGRVDDADIASIEKRFDEYEKKTAKIIEYYKQKGLLVEINGDQTVEAVHQEIMDKLKD